MIEKIAPPSNINLFFKDLITPQNSLMWNMSCCFDNPELNGLSIKDALAKVLLHPLDYSDEDFKAVKDMVEESRLLYDFHASGYANIVRYVYEELLPMLRYPEELWEEEPADAKALHSMLPNDLLISFYNGSLCSYSDIARERVQIKCGKTEIKTPDRPQHFLTLSYQYQKEMIYRRPILTVYVLEDTTDRSDVFAKKYKSLLFHIQVINAWACPESASREAFKYAKTELGRRDINHDIFDEIRALGKPVENTIQNEFAAEEIEEPEA